MPSRSFVSRDEGIKPSRSKAKDTLELSSAVKALQEVLRCDNKKSLQKKVHQIIKKIGNESYTGPNGHQSYIPLMEDLAQIMDSKTLERAKYYTKRLMRSLTDSKTNGINDINLYRWKEYGDILTDSLWKFDRRDASGSHLGWYWGNFVPQIPHQVILRFTKKGDWVLDPFAGSGTTLIESVRLGRNAIGIELNKATIKRAALLIESEPNVHGTKYLLREGDSTRLNFGSLCKKSGISRVQLLIMHPPYFDIIKFSNNSNDLSKAESVEKFLSGFGKVVRGTYPVLQDGRYLILVAGDKYQNGEWIPLGFYMMEEVLKNGFTLTGIIAKNFEDTRAKRDQQELWRYRALAGGFYVFKHEYIFVFKKKRES